MITLTGSLAAAQAEIARIRAGIPAAIEAGVLDTLDSLIADLIPVTPVKTGAMQADFTIAAGGGVWELLDTAESPRGYPYPSRVVFQPGFSSAYGALNAVLDSAEGRLDAAVDGLLAGLIGAP